MVILAMFIFSGISSLRSNVKETWENWKEARELYDGGKYEAALDAFKQNPSADASYYYNLGNVHFRLGKFGLAIANYEKAKYLRPHDPDIRHNLKLAQTNLIKTSGRENLDPASSKIESIVDNIPIEEARAILGLTAFLIIFMWTRPYLRTRSLRKTIRHPAGLCAVLAFAITGVLFLAKHTAAANPPAVCLERLIIRSGPGDTYLELTKIDEGTKIRVLGSGVEQPTSDTAKESWRQVRYAINEDGDELIGWIRESGILLL